MSPEKVQHPACSVIPPHMQRLLAEHGDDGRTPVVALAAVPLFPDPDAPRSASSGRLLDGVTATFKAGKDLAIGDGG